ncbi:ABC transporter permease [Pseudactinotalea sp.]|uniref:ABC transporter permease n=1 Tax=Pseudactinotalea sp. TaxID=1926260 RepID=UPI003B3B0D94
MTWKPFALIAALLAVTEAAVRLFDVPTYLVPAPSAVFAELGMRWDYFVTHVPATTVEIWVGFAIALLAGILLSLPIALTKFGEQALMPVLVATQSIPKTALAPIFVIWFGFGLTPKITMAAVIAFFPIVVNMVLGLRSVDPEIVQYLRTVGASNWEIFRKLRLPSSLPYLLAGMKVSISLATVGAIVGEFVGADQGLGFVILRAINNFDTVTMFAALLVVSVLGVLSYGAVALLERRALSWAPDISTSQTGA